MFLTLRFEQEATLLDEDNHTFLSFSTAQMSMQLFGQRSRWLPFTYCIAFIYMVSRIYWWYGVQTIDEFRQHELEPKLDKHKHQVPQYLPPEKVIIERDCVSVFYCLLLGRPDPRLPDSLQTTYHGSEA